MSAGKVTIVHCLSRLRRQAGREVAGQVQYCGRGKASDHRSGACTHRHAAIQAYTQVVKQTHAKQLKEKRGYLEIGWRTQPQQYVIKAAIIFSYTPLLRSTYIVLLLKKQPVWLPCLSVTLM